MSHVFDHFRHFGVQRPGIGYRKVPNDTENTEGYRRKPKNTEGYRRIPRDTEGHRRTPKDPEGCRRIPKCAEGCRRMPRRSSNMQAASQVFNPLSLFPFHAKPGLTRPWHPRRAQDAPKRGPRAVSIFFPGSWGAQGGKKGVQEGLETEKVERRRRRRHDHVKKGRQRCKKAAQVRPRAAQGAHQTLRIVGFTRAKRIFIISLLHFIFTPAGR